MGSDPIDVKCIGKRSAVEIAIIRHTEKLREKLLSLCTFPFG